uniref:Xylulose kinase-1 n=1 Tax=Tanacetum cinerariifolium TaxID=118510 RepID=A0A6L2JMS4_TANCI|nr:hypothetical protein [Tanacetum cinerariifolium]
MAPLTFADTHNMIAFLSKSDASAGFDQIVDFLNAQVIHYALMVNPTIYVSCIKQFWATALIKKVNDVVKLQALIDKKKVVVTEDIIQQELRLDDADGVECLPNEEIFVELARMSYEKPPPKLTFYKAFLSTQWNMVRNVDSPSKFLMYLQFLQVLIDNQVDDLSSHNTKYTSPALTQKVAAEEEDEVSAAPIPPSPIHEPLPPLHEPLPPPHEPITTPLQAQPAPPLSPPHKQPIDTSMTLLHTLMKTCKTLSQKVPHLEQDKIAQALKIIKLKGRIKAIDVDEDITLVDMETEVDLDAELQGMIKRKNDDNAAAKEVNAAEPTVFDDEEVTMIMAQTLIKMKAKKARILDEQMAKRLHDEEVEQDAMQEKHLYNIKKYQSLKRKLIFVAQARKNMIVYLKNMARYKMAHLRGMTYDQVRPIFEREYNKVQTLFILDKDVEEPSKKRVAEETLLQESFKKLRAFEVSVEALQVKYPLIDWEIHSEGSRSYWKIIRVVGITEAYQSFEDMLKGFEREDLDALWRLVKEKFNAVIILMLSTKLQVDEDCEMPRDLVMKIFMEANKPKSRRRIKIYSSQRTYKVAMTKEAQMKEVRKKSLRDFYKTRPSSSGMVAQKRPRVDKITPTVTSEGTDDSNGDNDLENEGNDEENKCDDVKTPSDSEKGSDTEQDTDKSESDSESDQQEYEEEVKDDDEEEEDDDDNSKGDEDREMDDTTNQFSDDVQDKEADVEITNAQQEKENLKITQEQVVEDARVMILTVAKETKVPDASFSHSFDLASEFLNFLDIHPNDAEIVSPLDVHHEVPRIHTSTLLTVPVSVIPEASPVCTTIPQSSQTFTSPLLQTTPTPPPTIKTTNIPFIILDFASAFQFNERFIALEKDVAELKKDPLHTQMITLVNDHLDTRMGAIREEFMNFLSASLTDRITEQVRNHEADMTRIKMKALLLDQTEGFRRERQANTQNQPQVQKVKILHLALPKEKNLIQNLLERMFNQKYHSSRLQIQICLRIKEGIWRAQHKTFYAYAQGLESTHDVYSTKCILEVTRVDVIKKHGYGYLREIEVRRADNVLYTFKEGDFPRLRLNDIKDMLILVAQNRLTNLSGDDVADFDIALKMFTRSLVIQKRVEDLQLGAKSYQKKINVTRPDTVRPDLQKRYPHTPYQDPQGFIYVDNLERNRLMRSDELYKLIDGILTRLLTSLEDITKNIHMRYLPKKRWSYLEKKRAHFMIKEINKLLKERRMMRNLEKFVGGRLYDFDPRLFQRTI